MLRSRKPQYLLIIFGTLAPTAARGQVDMQQAKAEFAREPPVAEVVQVALRYFRVHPDVLDGLRTQASLRSLLPLLAGGVVLSDDRFARGELSSGDLGNNFDTAEDQNKKLKSLSIGAVWDFRELVFNPAEVQVFGLIGVQRDIMLEATRTYYLRKQLLLRKLFRPPSDPMAQAALEMRIDEFTALLDVLTGGWFSEQIAASQ